MKKIFAIIICVMLLCAMTFVASAEEAIPADIEQTATETENSTPETEIATESEISGEELTITESIVEYVKANVEEILVIVATALGSFFAARMRTKTNGAIGTLNNNAIAIANNSSEAINKALTEVKDIANVVTNYKDEIAALLGEIRKSAEEKKSLEDTLSHVETFLKTAKLATLELADEVADLLLLANIPTSKKEEMYSHHCAAVKAIAEAETTEVKEDVNEA